MNIRIIHSIYNNDIYQYISTFLRLCGLSVYDHLIDLEEEADLTYHSVQSVYNIPINIVLFSDSETYNEVIRRVSAGKIIQIRCGNENRDFKSYRDLLEIIIKEIWCDCSSEIVDEMFDILNIYCDNNLFRSIYCDRFSYCKDSFLVGVLHNYVDVHNKLKLFLEKYLDKVHIEYAILALEYLVCSLSDRIEYVRSFDVDEILEKCNLLLQYSNMGESVNLLCAKLCELDTSKHIYAYEYYLNSIRCSVNSKEQDRFWNNFKIGIDGKYIGEFEYELENEAFIKSITPNNYIALFGIGDACFKYNNSERAGLFCYKIATKSNPLHFQSIHMQGICEYNLNNTYSVLYNFNRVYSILESRMRRGLVQPFEFEFFIRSARNISRLSNSNTEEAAKSLCGNALQNSKVLKRIIEMFDDNSITVKDLVINIG